MTFPVDYIKITITNKVMYRPVSRVKANRKEWISKETWEIIEQRKVAKNTTNIARTRKQKRDANKRYQELNREVKRRCRRDRRVYVESEAERAEEAGKRGDARPLYEITRKLCGRFQNTCKFALDEKLREEQAAFRDGRSCTDQIATLRIIVEQRVEWQSSL